MELCGEISWAVVVHTFNLSAQEAEAGGPLFCEFKASLVYKVSSRTDSIATGKHCLEKTQ